jgi:polyhydroxyalkanoate synthesis regulator phasin
MSGNMIKGISDLGYSDAKRLIVEIIERMMDEEKTLLKESEEKKIEILHHEYQKRLTDGHHAQAEKDKAIEACNRRMDEIEAELYALNDRKNYFEIQLEMLGTRKEA